MIEIVKNLSKYEACRIPGTYLIHETPSTDRRSVPNLLGLLTYGGDPRTVGTMAPKKGLAITAKGRSKSTTQTHRIIDEDTTDPVYVPPTGRTSPTAPRTARNQSKQMVPNVVTASQSDEEDTLIGSPAGFAFGYESHSTFETAFGSAIGSSSQGRVISSDKATRLSVNGKSTGMPGC
uniref:Integrase core domain containing protein n=1 Tax=Solanum tuberosum TaxID=4113 RepID=M1DUU6_SOLTU